MLDRYSNNDESKRDIPSFIEPLPPLISNPFMRPRPQKGTNLLELFEEDSECEEPELVQVYLRLKPYHARNNLYEVRGDRCLITSVDTATAGHGRRTQHNVSKMYTFSHIFGSETTQKEIFEHVVKDNLKKLPDGHNFTLLTYGASGSGKTYTLMGTVASPGLVPRSLEYVFRVVDAAQQPLYKPSDGGSEKLDYAVQDYELQWVKRLRHISAPLRDKYRRMSAGLCNDLTASSMDLSNRTRHYVWVSFVEIYNEGIYDLLAPGDRRNASKLRIREDSSGNVYVKDLTQAFVRTGEEAYDVMVAGKHNLQVAATGVHAQSSRSHCIFTITMLTETERGVRSACVRLCDLAGCERARRTRNTGARMAESRAINSSLHVLERCLHTLRRRQRRLAPACVPYRESKLTRLLGAGLSGCRGEAVSMVVTLNPAPDYAHETKHVLQLAAVAKDIQVNSTIAETTLESSTQDTTIGSTAEVMRLRTDNERLHFELLQAQSRNKELSAAMEERQQEAAATMRELVEEAKDMTRQYYEAQMQSLREEMEEMVEEYEGRLSKAAAPAVGGSGTPSRMLQNKIAQLMTEIAILEEKITAERLARARAEEEVQHLRACIDERDEKESASEKDVMLLSDSDHDSEEDDPCNESLEPTFKKEDINRSRLIAQNTFDQSVRSDKTLDDTRDNDRTIGNDEHDSALENDRTVGNDDDSLENDRTVANDGDDDENDCTVNNDDQDSVISKTEDTFKDDNTETTKESNYGTGEDSVSTNNMSTRDSRNDSDIGEVSEKRFDDKVTTHKIDEKLIQSFTDSMRNENDSMNTAPRGTYFVRISDAVDDDDDLNDVATVKKTDSLTRGTYFVKDSQSNSIPYIDDVSDEVNDIEHQPSDSPMDDIPKIKSKVSGTLVSKIMKSIKTSNGSNTSLAQFEQLEMAANNCDETKVEAKVSSFGNINMLKEKRTYFDETKKSLPKMVEEEEELIPVPKIIKEKKTYFDNIDANIESASNNKVTELANEILQIDDTRSPSIVKDEITNDFKPSTIKKLLGESFTRQPNIISSVNKNTIVHKKHDSVDIFEGLDSPLPIGTKVTEKIDVVEQARQSIEQLVLDQRSASKVKQEIKVEQQTISEEESFEISPVPAFAIPSVNTKHIENDKGEGKRTEKKSEAYLTDLEKESSTKAKIPSHVPTIEISSGNVKFSQGIKVGANEKSPQRDISKVDVKMSTEQNIKSEHKINDDYDTKVTNKDSNILQQNITINKDNKKVNFQNETIASNNTIEEFENLCKDVSSSRATEFDMLVSQGNTSNASDRTANESIGETKYNLRHKPHSKADGVKFCNKIEMDEEVLLESHAKCESRAKPTKRSLRLRRRKNQTEDVSDQEGKKLKDIVNLQKEFSDVTMDMPAPAKEFKDIQSPEKVAREDENVPPLMGIQSCPSKSVTRSRRKLFTPRAEALDEAGPGDSGERVHVPRPSYHRARARRKL